MNKEDKKKIIGNIAALEEQLNLNNEFQRLSVQKKIFSQEMMNDIMKRDSPTLDYCVELVYRGPEAFSKFINLLIETKQYEIARLLVPNLDLRSFSKSNALGVSMKNVPVQKLIPSTSTIPHDTRDSFAETENGTETSLSRDVSEIPQELLLVQDITGNSEPTNLHQLPEKPAISAYPRSNAEIGEDVSPAWYGASAPEPNVISPGEPPVISNVVSPRRSLEKAMDVDIQDKFEEAIEERYKCKVCLDKRIEVILLPCGHLASCSSCTSALANCPLCRQVIGDTAKAFLP